MTNRDQRAPLRTLAVLALLAFGLGACVDSDEPIIIEPAGGELFDRYVALGNSITAGFQSGGIHVDLQKEAYPVLLAQAAGARFGIPALAKPGCPPPLDGPLGQPISTAPCATTPRTLNPPPLVQNLAVPGATVTHLSAPLGTGTPLNAFILGGRTQLGAMIDADPTLVSVWIGNNDALGAALYGDTLLMTPQAAFQSEFDEVATAINETDAADAILIGVTQHASVAPVLQPGAYYYALGQNPPPGLPPVQVDNNCAPGAAGGQNMVSLLGVAAQISAGVDTVRVDCVAGMGAPGSTRDFVLDGAELTALGTAIGTYNAYISQVADANGWIYLDPNTSFIAPALTNPSLIRKCQALATLGPSATPQEFGAAVQASCPVDLDPTTAETFFGSYFSYDGIHPSGEAHAVIADTLAGRIEAKHGVTLN